MIDDRSAASSGALDDRFLKKPRTVQALPHMTRLPSGDLAANIDGVLVTIVASHADRRRLRYWQARNLQGGALSPWASTPTVALAIAAAAIRRAG